MTATTCSHGHTGVCVDDMTPEAREAFAFAYRHAFDYVAAYVDTDTAEAYAAWYVDRYFVDSLEDCPSHADAYLRFIGAAV